MHLPEPYNESGIITLLDVGPCPSRCKRRNKEIGLTERKLTIFKFVVAVRPRKRGGGPHSPYTESGKKKAKETTGIALFTELAVDAGRHNFAPTGNRTRVSRMGILNDTTTPLVPEGAVSASFQMLSWAFL